MIRAASATLLTTVLLTLAACGSSATPHSQLTQSAGATASAEPATVLTAPTYRLAPMPVTPTWQPAGENAQPEFAGFGWLLEYRTEGLSIRVSYQDPTSFHIKPEGKGVPITMLGLPGRRYKGVFGDSREHTLYVVTDDRRQSVMVWGYDAALVKRLADGLRWQAMPIRPPFEVRLLPEGYAPSHISRHQMEFVRSPESILFVAVTLWKRYEFDRDPAAIDSTVNGNVAEVVLTTQQAYIKVTLPDGQTLVVTASVELGLDRGDLERLAAGVTITEDAVGWSNPS